MKKKKERESNFEGTTMWLAEEMGGTICECKGPEERVYMVCVKKKEEPRGGGEGKQVRVSVEEQGPSLRALPASTLDFSLREKGKRWKF